MTIFRKFLLIYLWIFIIKLYQSTKMSLKDRNICYTCLEVINQLKIVKNSSVCGKLGFLGFNGNDKGLLPQSELMCYELFYYFYYFKPEFFEDREGENCQVCSYLDKCEFYECVTELNHVFEKDKPFNKQKSFEKDVKSHKFVSVSSSGKKSFKNHVKDEDEEVGNNFDNLNDLTPDFIVDHFEVIKTKILHILDELVNLGKINKSIKEAKKNLVNLFIFNKLKNEKKIDVSKQDTVLKINNKGGRKDYLTNIDRLAAKFINIFDQYEKKVDELGLGVDESTGKDKNISNTDKVNSSMDYLTSFLQAYNQLLKLAHKIYNSNAKIASSIKNDFTEDKILSVKEEKIDKPIININTPIKNANTTLAPMTHKDNNTTKIDTKPHGDTIKPDKPINTIVRPPDPIKVAPVSPPVLPLPTLPPTPNTPPSNNEFKILMEKITKLEREQEKMNTLLKGKKEINMNIPIKQLPPPNAPTASKPEQNKMSVPEPELNLIEKNSLLTDETNSISNELLKKSKIRVKKRNKKLKKNHHTKFKIDKI